MLPTKQQPIYQLHLRDFIFGIQMLCVAFGGLVLVPIIAGLDPNVALFTAGVGTLIFQLVTAGKVPVFFGIFLCFSGTHESSN